MPAEPQVPFRQGRFDALPELPPPHGWHAAEVRDVEVTGPPYGRVRVRVRVLGAGPPLLLVHGLMTSSYSFRYVLAPLAEHFTVYAPDLPGSGESDAPAGPYDAPAQGELLHGLAQALGIAGCAVVGNSLGGYLCLHWLHRHPDAVGRLVVVHSPGLPELRLLALTAALAPPPVRWALAAFVRTRPERWAHRHVHYWDEGLKSREEACVYGAPLATDAGSRAFVEILAHAMRPPSMDRLMLGLLQQAAGGDRVGERVLLLYARRDPMVPPALGPRLAEFLPGCTFRWLERGSHFAHVDAPDLFLAEALPFLRGEPPGVSML